MYLPPVLRLAFLLPRLQKFPLLLLLPCRELLGALVTAELVSKTFYGAIAVLEMLLSLVFGNLVEPSEVTV